MKKFISGIVTGALLTSTIALAATYVAEPATFKVLVNGKDFTSDPPALVVNGSTYLPLRAIGDALSVPVEWNAELKQAEVGIILSQGETYSRTNPAPIGIAQKHTQEGFGEMDAAVSVKVIETIRGDKAWNKLIEDDKFSKPAPEGYEYLLAKVEVSILYTASDRSIEINNRLFECFSANHEKYDDANVYPGNELNEVMYQGGVGDGYLAFCVKKSDTAPKMVFSRNYNGTGGTWFNLQ